MFRANVFAHHQEHSTVFTASDIIVNDDQQDATILTYLFIPNQLYMFRANVFAHHQEHLTVFTASDIVHRIYCLLVSWMRCSTSSMTPAGSNIGGQYQKL